MEQHQPEPPVYIERVKQLDQAIFYCYNESSQRLPVSSRLNGFFFLDDKTLIFYTTHFPIIENTWNVFAAELHFYKKGIANSLILHGIAVIDSVESGCVQFNIQHAEYFEYPGLKNDSLLSILLKPYTYFYRKSSALLLHTFKRKDALSANA